MCQKIKLPHKQVEWKVDLILSYYRIIVTQHVITCTTREVFFVLPFYFFQDETKQYQYQYNHESNQTVNPQFE